ncbi:MAG: dihydropteroate synthase [Flavobacteriales bacterium]|nr:dihydropteroate synthase [Flavobacteriales bacterium]
MGVLNITSDSFFDGGQFLDVKQAVHHAEKMVEQGADILDIGASSSRPGSTPVPEDLELERIREVVTAVRQSLRGTLISVDTFRASVAREAVSCGAHLINDISAGDDDHNMIPVVGELGTPYIAMHKKGKTESMQKNPQYTDVVGEVMHYFEQKLIAFRTAGIQDVMLDPGFGFGKTLEHNYQLMRAIPALMEVLGCPLLVGISRKSMITRLLDVNPSEALNGTTSLNTIALLNGASVIRVHDVSEAVQVRAIVAAVQSPSTLSN